VPVFWVPALAFVIGLAFATVVGLQFRSRGKPYQAAWAFALLLFALASQQEALGILRGWGDYTYKLYYLFGGILDVAWLGAGTVLLLAPRRYAAAVTIGMGVLSVVAVAAVAVSVTHPELLRAEIPPRGSLTGPATLLAPLTNIVGSLLLIGGAAYSAWKAYRRRDMVNRVLGTALIAAGALIVAAGHSLAQVRGTYVIQPAAEALGIFVMFGGYLAVEGQRLVRARTRTAG
jgi:hypothetical protein